MPIIGKTSGNVKLKFSENRDKKYLSSFFCFLFFFCFFCFALKTFNKDLSQLTLEQFTSGNIPIKFMCESAKVQTKLCLVLCWVLLNWIFDEACLWKWGKMNKRLQMLAGTTQPHGEWTPEINNWASSPWKIVSVIALRYQPVHRVFFTSVRKKNKKGDILCPLHF